MFIIYALIRSLPSWVPAQAFGNHTPAAQEYWLLGQEARGQPGRWCYDVLLQLQTPAQMSLLINALPDSIRRDLHTLFTALHQRFGIRVLDEDGEAFSLWP